MGPSALWTIPVIWGSIALLGPSRSGAIFFVVFATVPALAWFSVRYWAWLRDDRETRFAALELATERAIRQSEAPPLFDQRLPWKDYVFDVEVARRRGVYEPPPI